MTERDVVLRERAAAAKAIEWVCARARRDYGINSGIDGLDTRRYVEETFPLPKVTRPRVVRDSCILDTSPVEWRVVAGHIEVRYADTGHEWKALGRGWTITPDRVRMLADLLATPNETVEE